MSLFVAIVPPSEAAADLRARLPGGPGRWTDPAQWHVTLGFLGEVPEERIAPLAAGLAEVAARTPPITLALRGAGSFGDRVLWAGVEGEVERLRGLAAEVARTAAVAGIEADRRPYRPHLTLAFVRGGVEPLVRALVDVEGPDWRAAEIVLFRSAPGPVYTPLETWALG